MLETYAYVIDEQGFIVSATTLKNGEKPSDNEIITSVPNNIRFKPKWNGVEWIEGETEEEKAERESQQLLESLKPSHNEIEDAELEIKMITLLTEMGVIQ